MSVFIRSLATMALLFSSSYALADAKQIRLGAEVGQLGLLGDVGGGGANSIGIGVLAGYHLSDTLSLDLDYLMSSHSEVDHKELNVTGSYYFSDYETAYPHLTAGMSFTGNKFKNIAASGDAVGLLVGGGLELELQRYLRLGLDARFVKAFEAKTTINNREVKTVQDSYAVLVRLIYLLNFD